MPEKQDIAGHRIYREIARHTLAELHSNLMYTLQEFFMFRDTQHTLVVAGHGPEGAPYSTNLDSLAEILGQGSMAMFDYNPRFRQSTEDAMRGIRNEKYGRFIFEKRVAENEAVDLRNIGPQKILIRKGDLRDNLAFADESVAAFDATLSLHHVTSYQHYLDHAVGEVFRVLESRGMFHWGTGIANMRVSEQKIYRFARHALDHLQRPVEFQDERDPGQDEYVSGSSHRSSGIEQAVDFAILDPAKPPTQMPIIGKQEYLRRSQSLESPVRMHVTRQGKIRLMVPRNLRYDDEPCQRDARTFAQYLAGRGFRDIDCPSSVELKVPLVDPAMEEDRRYMRSIMRYYDAIRAHNNTVFSHDPAVSAQVRKADMAEYSNAIRGLFEYYPGPAVIQETLHRHGFVDVTVDENSNRAWCNIVAFKP